uniref:hypothetical protein n=1 Tax=uncultured Proteiniphilum sp. TaxID=497637 RepID=UPI00260B82DA
MIIFRTKSKDGIHTPVSQLERKDTLFCLIFPKTGMDILHLFPCNGSHNWEKKVIFVLPKKPCKADKMNI